ISFGSTAVALNDPDERRIALLRPLVARNDGQRDYKFILDQHRGHQPVLVQHERLATVRNVLLDRLALEQRHLDLVADAVLDRRQAPLALELHRGLVLERHDEPAFRIATKAELRLDRARIRFERILEAVEPLQLDYPA